MYVCIYVCINHADLHAHTHTHTHLNLLGLASCSIDLVVDKLRANDEVEGEDMNNDV